MNAYEWRERDGEYRLVPTDHPPKHAWTRDVACIVRHRTHGTHVVTVFPWFLNRELAGEEFADLDAAMVAAETTLRKYATGLLMSLTLVGDRK